jgi:hypothetical protein
MREMHYETADSAKRVTKEQTCEERANLGCVLACALREAALLILQPSVGNRGIDFIAITRSTDTAARPLAVHLRGLHCCVQSASQ